MVRYSVRITSGMSFIFQLLRVVRILARAESVYRIQDQFKYLMSGTDSRNVYNK